MESVSVVLSNRYSTVPKGCNKVPGQPLHTPEPGEPLRQNRTTSHDH